jgi:protein SCO1
MHRTQKILTTILWGLMVVCMLALVGTGVMATRRDSAEHLVQKYNEQEEEYLPVLYAAPIFSLTDQNNDAVTTQSLRGRVWVAAFIFTQCAGPCPVMTAKMAQLQESVPDRRVMLVSFTVDPQRDTPEVLRKYAEQFGADHARWLFLTGTEQQMMDAARGMYITAIPATDDSPIIHSEKLLLIDANGNVRGIYRSSEEQDLHQLALDAKYLAGEVDAATAGRAS